MAKIRTIQLYRGTTAQNDAYTGSAGELTMDTTTNELRLHDGSTAGGHVIGSGGGVSGRNVGDIFYTTRTDSELNGAVECDGTTYNTTDFTGSQSIGDLLEDGKVPYVSMADYATEISTKGWCDSFGWDGTGNTTFKVPTLSAFVWQKLQEAVKGSGMTLGLTDGTNKYGFSRLNNATAAFNVSITSLYGTSAGTSVSSSAGNNAPEYGLGITTDSTKSGIVVDTTNNVAEHRVMVQLFVSATDEAVATCTSVLSDVAALKYDYVVEFQAPTAQNNYTWYRKYKSGWVEQGGIYTITVASFANFNLIVPMADSNYTATGNSAGTTTNAFPLNFNQSGFTTTTFSAKTGNAGSGNFYWQVSGMAA